MTDDTRLNTRVGALETRMAEVAIALGNLKAILDEVKVGLTNARPSMWVLIPSLLGFISMLIAGVVSVTSIRGDIAALYAVKDAREAQLARMQGELDQAQHRQWDSLVKERDYYKSRAGSDQ